MRSRLVIVGLPVVLVLMINAAYVASAVRLRDAEADPRQASLLNAELHSLATDLSQAEGGLGAYLLTRDGAFLEPLDRARQLLSIRHNRLQDLLGESQLDEVRRNLMAVSSARLTALEQIRDDLRSRGETSAEALAASRTHAEALRSLVSQIARRQDDIVIEQRAAARVLQELTLGLAVAGALAGVLAGMVAAILIAGTRESAAIAAPRPVPAPRNAPTLSGSVLIVDDDPKIRQLLHRWLAPCGLDIREAGDAPSALAAITAHAPAVILCDVHMPGPDGLWLADRVRALAPHIAIVLATADDRISPFESLREGIVSYVLKPFRRDQVLAAVEEGIRWSGTAAKASASSAPDPQVLLGM